ncbi:MAG: two-component system response regulator [Candidatus Azotimanducaceae bacterium]|jgi:two-component system response regulator|tara:strand:- start:2658 stop:3092 length:435 start_codon:yes stop_codon:yes gene_type:complete
MSPAFVLLVEDDPSDEALCLRAFRKANVSNEIVVVRDGAEALDYLFASGPYAHRDPRDLPNCVLLDIKLPKLNGLEVLSRIRANDGTRRLPVIMLTSSKEDSDLVTAYDDGANSFVVKPVDFAEFAEAVQQLGLYWLTLNEVPG